MCRQAHRSVCFFHGGPGDHRVTTDERSRNPLQSRVFFFGILFLLLFLSWKLFQPFVIYITVGLFVSILALPIDKKWEKILPNRIAAFGTLFTVFILLVGPIVGIGFALAKDAAELADSLQEGQLEEAILDITDLLLPGMTEQEQKETVNRLFTDTVQPWLIDQAKNLAAKAGGFLVEFGIAVTVILFVTYYVLTDGQRLMAYIRRAAPMPPKQLDFLIHEGHNGIKAVFFGQILTSLIQGGLGGIGFLVAGVPGAIVWAGVMAVLSLLPVIGPPVVWIPAAVILLIQGQIWQGVFLIAWGGIVVMQVDNFIRPKLIGDRADIHPLFVLIGVLGGVVAFGFMGLFLGPLLVGLTVSILKVWERDYLNPQVKSAKPDLAAPAIEPSGAEEE